MPDRWTEERDRNSRDRNWRSEAYGRGGERSSYGERRTFDEDEGRFYGRGRDRVFGEQDTGAAYNRPQQPRPGGGGYGAGGRYGRGEGYSRSYGGSEDYRSQPAWQDPNYQGVSPAMQQGEYELDEGRMTFGSQDYTRGGRFYGDDAREPIYREEYGQGGREYGREPRGYDAGYRNYGRGQQADRSFRREEGLYGNRDIEGRYAREMRRPSSGGTGGYDYERGYGDGGRRDHGEDRGGGFEDKARDAGDMFRRAGERISSWFSGDREANEDRGHRGRGPKNYQRPDERISDDAHQALTDDPWVDASQVSVSVSGGEVTLSGTVENREAKHRAERCVEDIPGVRHVQNNLRVDEGSFFTSPGRGYGDSVLETEMRKNESGASGATNGGEDSAATRTTTRRT
jgi:osmotically-inducible protein OsmY